MKSVIKYSLITALSLLFVGCGKTIKPLQPVSVAPITTIGSNVTKAKESNEITKKQIQAGDTKSAIESAQNTQAILEVTEKQIELYRAEILAKNVEIDKHNDEVAGLVLSRDQYKSAMWKRNWIILGLGCGYILIFALFIFKQVLRNNPYTGWIIRILFG